MSEPLFDYQTVALRGKKGIEDNHTFSGLPKFRPETTVKSSNKILTMGRCLSWDKDMPISSAHALTIARLEFSSMVLNMCNNGSTAITNNDPDKGHPCKTPNKMANEKIILLEELI